MEGDELLLRLTCALATIERKGFVETSDALTNMIVDLAACNAKQNSEPDNRRSGPSTH
jgi:hypothetical protein